MPPPKPVVVTNATHHTIVLIGRPNEPYYQLAALPQYRSDPRDECMDRDQYMTLTRTHGDTILHTTLHGVPLYYQLPVLPSATTKGSLGPYGDAIGAFIAADVIPIVIAYLTFTSDNSPLSMMDGTKKEDDYDHYGERLQYCLQGRLVTAVHDVTYFQELAYRGPAPHYRERRHGQSYARPIMHEYAPLSPPLATAMTYMIVELVTCVNRPRLKLIARTPAEIAHLQAHGYPHLTHYRTAEQEAMHQRVWRRRMVAWDREMCGSGDDDTDPEDATEKDLAACEEKIVNAEIAAENAGHHGACADWAKLQVTLDVPAPLTNVRITWNQHVIHRPVSDCEEGPTPDYPDDDDITPMTSPPYLIPIIPQPNPTTVLTCDHWLFPVRDTVWDRFTCMIESFTPSPWSTCSSHCHSTKGGNNSDAKKTTTVTTFAPPCVPYGGITTRHVIEATVAATPAKLRSLMPPAPPQSATTPPVKAAASSDNKETADEDEVLVKLVAGGSGANGDGDGDDGGYCVMYVTPCNEATTLRSPTDTQFYDVTRDDGQRVVTLEWSAMHLDSNGDEPNEEEENDEEDEEEDHHIYLPPPWHDWDRYLYRRRCDEHAARRQEARERRDQLRRQKQKSSNDDKGNNEGDDIDDDD